MGLQCTEQRKLTGNVRTAMRNYPKFYITKKGEKVNIIAGEKFSLNQLEDSIYKELKK